MIIASLIERETPSDKERPLISSVIYNRLAQASRSASTRRSATPRTTGRGRCCSPSSTTDTPYNTRLNAGLPPTPIGNPGLASLKAAAKPANTDYLFYVAKPGACHAFAETDAEHERNVAAYEAAREKNGGNAPPQKC